MCMCFQSVGSSDSNACSYETSTVTDAFNNFYVISCHFVDDIQKGTYYFKHVYQISCQFYMCIYLIHNMKLSSAKCDKLQICINQLAVMKVSVSSAHQICFLVCSFFKLDRILFSFLLCVYNLMVV